MKKIISAEFNRGGKMTDEQFVLSMACDESHPIWRGMLELLDRAEDSAWNRNTDPDLSREQRADIGILAGVIREIRAEMENARLSGIEQIKKVS